jgi:hypothetical protein
LALASCDKNWDGIAFGKTTSQAGSKISPPGSKIKIENGMNLIKSYFILAIF